MKVNLGRGVYKDDNGKNWVLPSVRLAEKKMFEEKQQHDYLPFKGYDQFVKRTSEFAFGSDSSLLRDKRVTETNCDCFKLLNTLQYNRLPLYRLFPVLARFVLVRSSWLDSCPTSLMSICPTQHTLTITLSSPLTDSNYNTTATTTHKPTALTSRV